MKNIFKLMGIALLGCSMLVACGNDEEAGYTLTWNGTEVTDLGYDAGTAFQTWHIFEASKSFNSTDNTVEFPYYVIYFTGDKKSNITVDTLYCEAYEKTSYNLDGTTYGDWQTEDVKSLKVEKFDASAHTMTATLDLVMYSLTAVVENPDIADAAIPTATFGLKLTDYEFKAAK